MKKFSMCGPLGDPLSPLTPVGYKVHWTRSPHQLPGSVTVLYSKVVFEVLQKLLCLLRPLQQTWRVGKS